MAKAVNSTLNGTMNAPPSPTVGAPTADSSLMTWLVML